MISRLPSVTAKRTASLSSRAMLPALTSPPTRMRVPGVTRFSTTSVGELKNTMESLSAESTRRAATPRTLRAEPIRMRRRCLRVMPTILRAPGASAFESKAFNERVEALNLYRVARQRTAGVGSGGEGLFALAEDRISTHQPQPSVEIGAVAIETLGESGNHPAHHFGTLAGGKLGGSRHVVGARPAP